MKYVTTLTVKSQALRLALLAVLITSAVGCADGDGIDSTSPSTTNGSPEFNVKVLTVDAEGNPLDTSYLSWGYMDSDGNTPNIFEVTCSNSAEKCSERLLGFEVDGEIWLHASVETYREPVDENGFPGCIYGLEGDASIDADPTQEQTVQIVVDHERGACP